MDFNRVATRCKRFYHIKIDEQTVNSSKFTKKKQKKNPRNKPQA
jgi:hypothetical protein